MRVYQRESERLDQSRNLVRKRYPRFGINKQRELVRLLYEISKRENIHPEDILPEDVPGSLGKLKAHLLKRRFPLASREPVPLRPYLPLVELSNESCFRDRSDFFRPRKIFIEEPAGRLPLAAAFKEAFPDAECSEISSLKDFLEAHTGCGIPEYNERSRTVFIVNEERDFFKHCPCTRGAVHCGYHVCNLSFGCLFECSYCFLQEYVNTPGIIFPANIDRFREAFISYRDRPAARRWQSGPVMRLGTGEFSDSLMLDHLTGYSIPLVEFFRGQDDVVFEFKTKSVKIDNLLKVEPGRNIVIGWSVNPQEIIDGNEIYAAALPERLEAARRVLRAGYRVAFHFDPVVYFDGWERAYRGVIEELFEAAGPGEIAWISLGTLRFKPSLKKIIEARFPGNRLLDEEMVLGYDDKLRYPYPIRYRIYRFLIDELAKRSRPLPVYLCMEARSMWKELRLDFPF